MKKGIISKRFLLYLLMLMFLVSAFGCSSSDDAAVVDTTYSISGTVTGAVQAGVTVNLTGASTATATTNADGEYTFAGLANGSYTVTPVLAGYVFAPISTAVTVNGSNMIADFVATASGAATYSLSGTVGGAVQQGVRMDLTGANTGSVTTGADGTYTFTGLLAGNYTVTPYLSGYAFTPAFRDVALAANSTGNNFTAAAQAYSQADLVGTWNIQKLEAGTENGWGRYNVTINIGGTLSFISCEESSGSTTCPGAAIVWTIDPTTGVIIQTEGGNPTDMHLSMTSNKRFIAGTQTGSSMLYIAQKKEDGVSYSNDDLQSKNFAIHSLIVGDENEWMYAQGYTDSSRIVILTSETSPAGTQSGEENTGSTISVDANGIVTISGTDMSTYRGFLSYDKKTIVGTFTDDGVNYQLMIIQITNGQSSTAAQLNGNWQAHSLVVGDNDPAPYWAHWTATLSNGTLTGSNYASQGGVGDVSTASGVTISASGVITIPSIPSVHGQMSFDGKFFVWTGTTYIDSNSTLQVLTR
jgi:hypothetical protein